jgi:hypothetical protein
VVNPVRVVCMISMIAALVLDAPAQERQYGLSLWAEGGWQFAAAPSMRASVDEAFADVSRDYVMNRYPYASPDLAMTYGLHLRLPLGSGLRLVGGLSMDEWSASRGNAEAVLRRFGVDVGVETTLLHLGESLSIFTGAGIQANLYNGWLNPGMLTFLTDVNSAVRLGLRGDVGLQWDVTSRWSARLSGSYAHGNILGASFTAPQRQPNQWLEQTELNDGRNPADATDTGRTISAFALRLALGFRF